MTLLRRLVVGLVLVLVLGVVLDAAARLITEQRIAAQLQTVRRLPDRPDVSIGGLSFLDQAVRGRFDHVRVQAGTVPPVTSGGLPLSAVDARLTGVSVPLADVLAGRVTSLPVQDVQAQARIDFAGLITAVSARLPGAVSDLRLSRAGPGRVLVQGRYAGLGLSLSLQAEATVSISGRDLVVTVPPDSLVGLAPALRTIAAGLLSTRVPLPALPSGLAVSAVSVEPGGLVFAVGGRDVRLTTSTGAAG